MFCFDKTSFAPLSHPPLFLSLFPLRLFLAILLDNFSTTRIHPIVDATSTAFSGNGDGLSASAPQAPGDLMKGAAAKRGSDDSAAKGDFQNGGHPPGVPMPDDTAKGGNSYPGVSNEGNTPGGSRLKSRGSVTELWTDGSMGGGGGGSTASSPGGSLRRYTYGNLDQFSALGARTEHRPKPRLRRRVSVIDIEDEHFPRLTGLSLGFMGPTHPIRVFLLWLTHSMYFETFSMAVIFVSSLMLSLDSPRLDPAGLTAAALAVMDRIFIVIFAAEMLLKVIALDLFWAPTAYMRNNWNLLDGAIAWFGIIEWLLQAFPPAGFGGNRILQTFRCVRALRPLRIAKFLPGMKIVITALFQALASILNVGLVVLLIFCMLAIVGTNLFAGQFYNCVWAPSAVQPYGDVGLLGMEIGDARIVPGAILDPKSGVTIDKAWCNQGYHTITWPEGIPPYNLTHTWSQTYMRSFDHIGVSLLALFEMATTSLWLDVMWSGVDAAGVDQQPVRDFNRACNVFFIVAMILLWMMVLNLFVGSTIDKFVKLREKLDCAKFLLTFEQQQWVKVQTLLLACQPHSGTRMPHNPLRRLIYHLVTSKGFDMATIFIIFANIAILCCRHANQEPGWDALQIWFNVVISVLFLLEAVMKLIAFGVGGYFQSNWNRFDFLVVLVCFMGIGIEFGGVSGTASLSLIRVLRVGSIFRLVPKAKRLLKLFQTLVIALPALGNMASLTLLFFYIFSVIAMNLFGSVRRNYYLKRHSNFEDFPNALLLLFRMTGGENWNGVMRECMNMASCILVTDMTSPLAGGLAAGRWYNKNDPLLSTLSHLQYSDHCSPSAEGAILFFLGAEIVLTYVIVNLFVTIILDGFQVRIG